MTTIRGPIAFWILVIALVVCAAIGYSTGTNDQFDVVYTTEEVR